MTAVADYSFARPDPSALKAAGYAGVMRYVCQDTPQTHGKLITATEYASLRAAGLTVVLNFEWYTTRPLEGAGAGSADAQIADAQADAIGYPVDWPIYYSVDTSASHDQVNPYFLAVHARSRRPVGFYGGQPAGLQLLREGTVQRVWVANAASWSGFTNWSALRAAIDPAAHLVQHLDHPLGFDGQIDHNEVLRPDWAGGNEDMPLTQADADLVAATVKVQVGNYVIGTLQDAIKQAVAAIQAKQPGSVDAHAVLVALHDALPAQ